MDSEKMRALESEIAEVATRHGVSSAAFCGTSEDDAFVGFFVGKMDVHTFFDATLNVGRLWQHAREQVRNTLNSIAKKDW